MLNLIRALAALSVLATTAAAADTWPSRQITIVVPFAPGSGTDSITRIIGQYLQTALGQSVVVENKVAEADDRRPAVGLTDSIADLDFQRGVAAP